jgi:hypothetical protein
VRLLFDPVGYFHDLNGMVLGAAPLVGLGPDGAPSVWDSWKTVGKDVSHWDQWDTDPAGAFGRTLFDAATFALPGGPLSKLGTKSRAALDAIKGFKKPTVPKLPAPQVAKPPETPKPPPAPEQAPGAKPPEPGSPAPPPKPGPAPTGTPPPHSPTEPKPSAPPPVSAGKPSVPAESTPVPQAHESVPARVPVSPGGSPREPVPNAATSAASTPAASMPSASAPSTPHLPSPPSVPMGGGAPAEAPLPHGGAPHGGEPGAHEPHHPHDGPPHPPGDGDGPPHQPGDGNGHPPTDGTPHEPGDDPDHDGDHGKGHTPLSDLPPWRQAQLALAESPEQLVNDLVKHGCPPEIAESALHSPYSGMTAQQILDKYWDPLNGTWDWPKRDGFAFGKWETVDRIPTDIRFDRIAEVSETKGDYMGTAGDSYPQRSLAPGSSGDYNIFEGTGEPLPEGWRVRYGKVADAFGHLGGGTQWVVVDNDGAIVMIDFLLRNGYLRRLRP